VSIRVDLDDLASTMRDYEWAYVLTVRDDSTPHAVAVTPAWSGRALHLHVGPGSARNAATRSSITLVFPPVDGDGYSLIVDGEASVTDDVITFAPSTAVLHRPAPPNA
jgi:hypothetical protein